MLKVKLYNKSKLKNGIKTFLELKFLFIVEFKKLGFSIPLVSRLSVFISFFFALLKVRLRAIS